MQQKIPASLLLLLLSVFAMAQPGGRSSFDAGWRFTLGGLTAPTAHISTMRKLDLPHDWSIEGEFNEKNPATNSGGSLPGGIGWYFNSIELTGPAIDTKYFIEFDGVYMNSTLWINGSEVGTRPYGYATFQYDITRYLNPGSNSVVVRVNNAKQPNSRWYSGSGIYRHVWLIKTNPIHFTANGTYFTTPVINNQNATVHAQATVQNETGQQANVEVRVKLFDAAGKQVGEQKQTQTIAAAATVVVGQYLQVSNPQLWDVDRPYLYKAVTEIYSDNKLQQSYTNNIGIRYFHFDSDKGFSLNGKPMKILGVCNHHDLGCLGTAINERALQRQLQILKDMGCNAIRTSHNPPAPELLDLCDKMGFLVMDEAFDCWNIGKNKYDFHLYFKKWSATELRDMVLRDRSHPSVILWSIGNEIPEQGTPDGGFIARRLSHIIRQYDTTRLITSALSSVVAANGNGYSSALDVIGINYDVKWYDSQKKKYPHRLYIGSETTSAVVSRGVYHMPANKLIYKTPDQQCSAYDNCWVPWGNSAEEAWLAVKKRDFMSGMFVWTGFDYIGEPTPYNYPAVSSYFGIIDLCGFPKDPYYLYQSQWTKQPVLHLLPHWNWNVGDSVDVLAFTNCDEVKLYLNGNFIGSRTFAATDKIHLAWRVAYAPGTLKAEGYKNGTLVKTDEVKTAGPAAKITLTADSTTISPDGKDLAFITVKVTDANGVLVPNADQLIYFETTGEGRIVGVDNGNAISLEPHKASQRKAFSGMCLVVLQNAGSRGSIKLKATATGLDGAEVVVKVE